jgi:predicted dehydrogenase
MKVHSDPVRLGIIGTGLAVEKLHWPVLQQLTEAFRVAAFSNRGRENAERFSAYSGIGMDAFVPDYHDLLRRDDVDAVLISVPIPVNKTIIQESLEAGKHVFAEKPPGMNEAEAWELLATEAAHTNQRLLLAENHFYRDDVRLARSLVDQELLGRIHLMSWRNIIQLVPKEGWFPGTKWRQEATYDGGPHLDAGVHHMAWIRMLCGDVTHVAGEIQDANSTHEGPSDLTLNLRFVSGAVGNYTGAYPELPMPDEPNDLRIYGTEGVLTVRWGEVCLYRPGQTDIYTVRPVDRPWYPGRYNGFHRGYYNELRNFREAIVHGVPIVGTLMQSIRTMELVLKGIDSARTGKIMEMDTGHGPLLTKPVPFWTPWGSDDEDIPYTHSRE